VLQPTLDDALPEYRPRTKKLSGDFKAGASDVLPGLARAWVAAFQKYHPDVRITIEPPYAGSLGAKELVAGKLDIVFVSRELKPDDITEFQAKYGYAPLSVPISGGSYRHFGFLDAVGFYVHPENPLNQISFQQLDAILSSTRHRGGEAITKWGQLGLTGAWANEPVHVYGIQPWNGFEEFVRQRVLSVGTKRGEWREGLHFDKVVFPVAKEVAADRLAIGYAGLAYLDAPVKVLALAESGPPISPTYENVATASYPLSRLIYLNTRKEPGKALPEALDEFLRFILSREGQRVVLEQRLYMTLRAFQVERARKML
jgi:phosphate transport system substrate-binding protein